MQPRYLKKKLCHARIRTKLESLRGVIARTTAGTFGLDDRRELMQDTTKEGTSNNKNGSVRREHPPRDSS